MFMVPSFKETASLKIPMGKKIWQQEKWELFKRPTRTFRNEKYNICTKTHQWMTLIEISGRINELEDWSKEIILAHKFNNLDELEQSFENHQLLKFTWYKIGHLNSPINIYTCNWKASEIKGFGKEISRPRWWRFHWRILPNI